MEFYDLPTYENLDKKKNLTPHSPTGTSFHDSSILFTL